jgi:hypothetical protein
MTLPRPSLLRLFVFSLCVLGIMSSVAAHAQTGIYATFDASRRSSTNVFLSPPTAADNTATAWLYGPTVGFYYDFLHLGPVHLGSDVRGEFVHGGGFTRDSFLVGARLSVHPPLLPVKPYLQASVGLAHSKGIISGNYSNNPEYQIAGGVDFTILPRIDWRVLEVGGGSLLNYTYGSGVNQTNNIVTFSTGIVFRLP